MLPHLLLNYLAFSGELQQRSQTEISFEALKKCSNRDSGKFLVLHDFTSLKIGVHGFQKQFASTIKTK